MNLYHSGPRLSMSDIRALESEFDCKLDADYIELMLSANGGVPEPAVGIQHDTWIERVMFYQLYDSADRGIRRATWELRENDIEGYLAISGTSNERDICLRTEGNPEGVYATERQNYSGVVTVEMLQLAPSFASFLAMLVVIPDPYCQIEDLGECGNQEDLLAALAGGLLIDQRGKNDLPVISEAIKFGNLPVFLACLENGASLTGTVYIAVQNRRPDVVRVLIAAGADINERDKYGHTPFSYVGGTALPGERGSSNRELERVMLELGAIK